MDLVFAQLAPGQSPLSSSPAIPRPTLRSPAFEFLRERQVINALFDALERFL